MIVLELARTLAAGRRFDEAAVHFREAACLLLRPGPTRHEAHQQVRSSDAVASERRIERNLHAALQAARQQQQQRHGGAGTSTKVGVPTAVLAFPGSTAAANSHQRSSTSMSSSSSTTVVPAGENVTANSNANANGAAAVGDDEGQDGDFFVQWRHPCDAGIEALCAFASARFDACDVVGAAALLQCAVRVLSTPVGGAANAFAIAIAGSDDDGVSLTAASAVVRLPWHFAALPVEIALMHHRIAAAVSTAPAPAPNQSKHVLPGVLSMNASDPAPSSWSSSSLRWAKRADLALATAARGVRAYLARKFRTMHRPPASLNMQSVREASHALLDQGDDGAGTDDDGSSRSASSIRAFAACLGRYARWGLLLARLLTKRAVLKHTFASSLVEFRSATGGRGSEQAGSAATAAAVVRAAIGACRVAYCASYGALPQTLQFSPSSPSFSSVSELPLVPPLGFGTWSNPSNISAAATLGVGTDDVVGDGCGAFTGSDLATILMEAGGAYSVYRTTVHPTRDCCCDGCFASTCEPPVVGSTNNTHAADNKRFNHASLLENANTHKHTRAELLVKVGVKHSHEGGRPDPSMVYVRKCCHRARACAQPSITERMLNE